jgi:hypothetical protein
MTRKCKGETGEKRHVAIRGIQWERQKVEPKRLGKDHSKCAGTNQDMVAIPKKKKHIRLHTSLGGAAVASLAGPASSGVDNCGLESESILSGLPLPHESSRMICATPGRFGLVSGGPDLLAGRELEGDGGSTCGGSLR